MLPENYKIDSFRSEFQSFLWVTSQSYLLVFALSLKCLGIMKFLLCLTAFFYLFCVVLSDHKLDHAKPDEDHKHHHLHSHDDEGPIDLTIHRQRRSEPHQNATDHLEHHKEGHHEHDKEGHHELGKDHHEHSKKGASFCVCLRAWFCKIRQIISFLRIVIWHRMVLTSAIRM